jgi:cytochrome c oxidase subunit 1
MHTISTIGSFILGASVIPATYNVVRSWRHGRPALRDDPWGHGNSLEWATSSPPPRHNFVEIPRIRSERPAFELHYPHLKGRLQEEAHAGRRRDPYVSEVGLTKGARAGANDPDPT